MIVAVTIGLKVGSTTDASSKDVVMMSAASGVELG